MSFARAVLVASLALPLVAACSSRNGPSTAEGVGAAGYSGGDGAVSYGVPTDTYVANLAKPGEQGKYTFTLVQAVPAPPSLDGNVWTLKIADANGASPTLAQVGVLPFMPQMGHGSDQTPQITANADGTFTVADVFLFMTGLWTVTVSVTAPVADDAGADGGTTTAPVTVDQAVFTFGIN